MTIPTIPIAPTAPTASLIVRSLTYRERVEVLPIHAALDHDERAGLSPAEAMGRVHAPGHLAWAAFVTTPSAICLGSRPVPVFAGYAIVATHPAPVPADVAQVVALAVAVPFRRRGIGTALVGAVLEAAGGLCRVEASVSEVCRGACECLAACGFSSRLVRARPGEGRDVVSFTWVANGEKAARTPSERSADGVRVPFGGVSGRPVARRVGDDTGIVDHGDGCRGV